MSDKEILKEIDRLKKYTKPEWTIEEMYQVDNAIIHLQYMLIENRINRAIEHIETHQLCYQSQYEEMSGFDNHLLDILRGKDNDSK